MQPKKVLIIDDEALIRKTTELLLKRQNVTAVSSANGTDGLAAAISEKPDLILLDVMMPGENGWEVLRKLKQNSDCAKIPVIMYTAIGDEVTESSARERGAKGILRKPFQMHHFLTMLECSGMEEK